MPATTMAMKRPMGLAPPSIESDASGGGAWGNVGVEADALHEAEGGTGLFDHVACVWERDGGSGVGSVSIRPMLSTTMKAITTRKGPTQWFSKLLGTGRRAARSASAACS